MAALVAFMQFNVAIIDLLWIFDLIRDATFDFHQGLRARLDVILTGCLLLFSFGVAFVHSWWLAIPLLLGVLLLTVWCLAYVMYDQLKIFRQNRIN